MANTINKLKLQPSISTAIENLQSSAVKAAIFSVEHRYLIHPDTAARRIRAQIEACGDIQVAQKLMGELAQFTSPGFKELSNVATGQLMKLVSAFHTELCTFCDTALQALGKLRADAIGAETSFFEEHGFPHESTSVSRSVDAAITRMKAIADESRNPHMAVRHIDPTEHGIWHFLEVTFK